MSNKIEDTSIVNDRLYLEVAKELNISEEKVKSIVLQQALTTRRTIERGAFENIRYVYLGAIKANHKSIQRTTNEIGRDPIIKKIIK